MCLFPISLAYAKARYDIASSQLASQGLPVTESSEGHYPVQLYTIFHLIDPCVCVLSMIHHRT
jgi:hypothetical protein